MHERRFDQFRGLVLQIYPPEILHKDESQCDSISALIQVIAFFSDWLPYGDSEGAGCCLKNLLACTAPHVRDNETKPHCKVRESTLKSQSIPGLVSSIQTPCFLITVTPAIPHAFS